MEVLSRGEKREWEGNTLDEHLMRSGCVDLWDAVFTSFSWYRELKTREKQQAEIQKRLGDMTGELKDWVNRVRNELYYRHTQSIESEDTDLKIFFNLFSLKILEASFLPFLRELNPEFTKDQFCEETRKAVLSIAEYRLKKKARDVSFDEVKDPVLRVFEEILKAAFDQSRGDIPDEYLIKAGEELEHNLILISPEEKVLFDTRQLIPDSEFWDNILVLVLPTGYESIGRISFTRDGHKKLSRIFPFDDPVIVHLRSHLKKQ